MIRLAIVDDEAPARAKLRRLLSAEPDVAIAGEAADGPAALALLAAARPDAVFLDIQMPGKTGLEVAAELLEELPVVFVTAYEQHAVRAFDLNAVDYLLKPYTRERFATTLARLRQRLLLAGSGPSLASGPGHVSAPTGLPAALHQLQPVSAHWLLPHRGGLRKLPLAEVLWVQAADNYIEFQLAGASYLDRLTLTEFLEHAAAAGFVRIHRSCAVQLRHVTAVVPTGNGDAEVVLADGRRLRVSRSHRETVLAKLRA